MNYLVSIFPDTTLSMCGSNLFVIYGLSGLLVIAGQKTKAKMKINNSDLKKNVILSRIRMGQKEGRVALFSSSCHPS
jgi:hypothetical protein